MITRQQIEHYTSLKREIAALEDQIYGAESSGDYAVDMVRGSTKEIPYAMHNIVIKGYTTPHTPKLKKRKAMREKECREIECFVESIDNIVMRQIITWRYIDGKTVAETAALCEYSVRQIHRMVSGFFEKMADGVT